MYLSLNLMALTVSVGTHTETRLASHDAMRERHKLQARDENFFNQTKVERLVSLKW